MDRVERSIDMEGGAFSMFETAIALESVVRDRTSALENANERAQPCDCRTGGRKR